MCPVQRRSEQGVHFTSTAFNDADKNKAQTLGHSSSSVNCTVDHQFYHTDILGQENNYMPCDIIEYNWRQFFYIQNGFNISFFFATSV